MNSFQRLGRIVKSRLSRFEPESSVPEHGPVVHVEDPPPKRGKAKHGSRRWAFEVLEMEEGASREEIRKAYLRLSRKYHPDNFAGNSEKLQTANTLMAQINNAYDLLGD
jgi:DnaJ-domain-containing protein 1